MNERILNSGSGSIGSRPRISTAMKSVIATADPANRPRIMPLPQPSPLPRSRASTSMKIEALKVSCPHQSMWVALGSRDSASFR